MEDDLEGGATSTDRGKDREEEEGRFESVIVKRVDETRRHPDDVLQAAIEAGVEQLRRPPVSLLLAAVGAGLIVAFTAMAAGIVQSSLLGTGQPLVQRFALALVYPLGFVICLTSGNELLTEHTATAVYPVLDRRSGPGALARLWLLVGCGNLVGTALGAYLLALAEPVVSARDGYATIAADLVIVRTIPLLASALLAGWLMALGAWLVLSTPPDVSQIVSIYFVTFLIGLGGLHHSIAGSAEVLAARFTGAGLAPLAILRFVALAVAGNLLGGSLFVASLNYAHIRKTREEDD